MSDKFKTELRDPRTLKPYPKNAKKHSPAQIATLKGLIETNGWTQPVVIDKWDEIIIGHGRTLAGIEIGKQIPVLVFQGSKKEAAALRIADNQVTSKDYDMDLLKGELAELSSLDMDISGLGFSTKELEFLTVPLETMDESLFVDDIQGAVEDQREKNDERTVEIDGSTAPLADAFGFRRFTVAQSRRVRAFMTKVEGETGAKGAEALMKFLDEMGVEG